jgi:hypothetical protein
VSTATRPVDATTAFLSSPWRLAQICQVATKQHGMVWFDLWDLQRDVLELAVTYREVVVLKARQLGVSWALALLALWDCLVYPVGLTLVVSIGEDEASEFIDKVRVLYQSLPTWMQQSFPVEVDNSAEFTIRHHGGSDSTVQAMSSTGSAGRSKSARRVIGDERAWWKNAAARMTSLRATFADGGSYIDVSTANGFDGFRDRYMNGVDVPARPVTTGQRVQLEQDQVARIFVPADARPGRTEEWIRVERRKADLENPGTGAQEYPMTDLEAFIASGNCDFDTASLQWFLDNYCTPPPWRGSLRDVDGGVQAVRSETGQWLVWEEPRPGRTYIVGGDYSGGGASADATALTVYDAGSWDQVAAFHGRPNPDQAARETARAGRLWRSPQGPSLLVPEANNHGQAVVAHLIDSGYPNVYEPEKFDIERGGTHAGRTHGWLMNGRSKHTAVSALQEGVRDRLLGIRDAAAIGEMLTFYGMEALEGRHDDRVVSHAIPAAVLKFSARGRVRVRRELDQPFWRPKDPVAGY